MEPSVAEAWSVLGQFSQALDKGRVILMTHNRLLFLRLTGARPAARIRAVVDQVRTIASLYVLLRSEARARGRRPMLQGIRDYALGRYGPAPMTR